MFRNRTVERTLALVFLFVTLLFLLSAAMVFVEGARALETQRQRDAIHERIHTLQTLLSTFQDAETGQRGYLLTGNVDYLTPYHLALQQTDRLLQELRRDFDGDPEAETDLTAIAAVKDRKYAELNATISARRGEGLEAALPTVLSNAGKSAMDELRAVTGRLIGMQYTRLAQSTAVAAKETYRLEVSAVLLLILMLLGTATAYATIVRDLRERRRLTKRLDDERSHDLLTQLPNRPFFAGWLRYSLATARREGTRAAVLYVHLDGYRRIAEHIGREAGNALLKAVAQRFKERARESDIFSRVDEDRFMVLVPSVARVDDLAFLANRLIGALAEPLLPVLHEHPLGASIGIAVFPDDAANGDALLAAANAAMLRAEAAGANRYAFFGREADEPGSREERLASDLYRAVAEREFRLLYQPVVELQSGRMIGVEALIRWRHPAFGELGADEFIPIAERNGAILPIGAWVVRAACAQAAAWQKAVRQPLRISVNVLPSQLLDGEFAQVVRDALAESGLPPQLLQIEIVERVLAQPHLAGRLATLKGLGVTLAVDDFGTGYSSLGYLKHFAIDTLKIDRSFIAGVPSLPFDTTLTRTILAMARELGIGVIAEGVETRAQRDFLARHGCALGQGFLFAPPLEPDDVPGWRPADDASGRQRA
ncbi:MAG: putative bifunctional diguanylate cyclase/phosphodiesterase [Burkholderiaceae bacterium]